MLTLCFVICAVIFGLYKTDFIVLDKDIGHQWSTSYLASYTENSKAVFDKDNGLQVAFGIASHPNSEINDITEKYDDKIATIKAYFIREGYQSNSARHKVPLTIHSCEPNELVRNFYKTSRDHSAQLSTIKN